MNSPSKKLLLSTATLLLLLTLTSAAVAQQATPPGFLYVTTQSANVVVGSNVIGQVNTGSRFMILQTSGEYHLINIGRDKEEKQGWIHTSVVLRDPLLDLAQWKRVLAADQLLETGKRLQAEGRYTEALASSQQALAVYEELLGKDHPQTADALVSLGGLHDSLDNQASAEPLLRRALKIYEARLGKNHPTTGNCVNSLAGVCLETGRYRESESLYQRGLKIAEETLGKDHINTAAMLNNLANLYNKRGLYSQAEPLFRRALAIGQAKHGENAPEVGPILSNLGIWNAQVGRHEEAVQLLQRGIELSESKLGKDHPNLVSQLSSLAGVYSDMGQYGEAELLCRRCLDICEKKLGQDHSQTAAVLVTLAELYSDTGQIQQAEPLLERSLEIRKSKLGQDHPQTADSLISLGELYARTRRYEEALPLFRRCLEIRQAKLGEEHADTLTALNNIAYVHHDLEQYDKAVEFYQRTLEISEAALGKDHADTGRTLNNLAQTYKKLGRYDQAESHLRRALAIAQARNGGDHSTTVSTLRNLGDLYFETDRVAEGRGVYDRVLRARRRDVTTLLPAMSQAQQQGYLRAAVVPNWRDALSAGFWHGRSDAVMAEFSASWLANGKGMQQEAQALAAQLQSLNDEQARPLALGLHKVRQSLAALKLESAKPGLEGERQAELDRLELQQRELTAQLQKLGSRTGSGEPWTELKAIRTGLSSGSVLIDFAYLLLHDFKKNDWDSVRFAAWVTPKQGAVRLVDLGPALEINNLVQDVQREMIETAKAVGQSGEIVAEEALQAKTRALAKRLLDPLLALDEVKNSQQWVLCPDGNLWLVPWAALPLEDGTYAVEQHVIRLVNSGRDVAGRTSDANTVKTTAPLVLADPDFDLGRDAAARKARELADRAPVEQTRSLVSAALQLGGVPRLPNTAVEAARIAPSIEKLLQQPPRVLTSDQALEAVVKATQHPKMMVFSTHGFFLPEQQLPQPTAPGNDEKDSQAAMFTKDGRRYEEPLLRCGLLMAACNDQPEEGQTRPGDDGVLTGLEVVNLDLRGCELVVLSACETGVSNVRFGEGVGVAGQVGVAGLRQAFQLAGAQAVMSSLWKVPDRETAQLMIDVFQNLAAGQDRPTALALAQRKLIERRRERYGAAHPFFWAAFTLTGQEAGTLAELETAKEFNDRGNKFFADQAFDLALADYDAALKLDPHFASPHHNRGLVFKARGESDQALECMTKAIELDPEKALFYKSRALLYRGLKQYPQALEDFNQVVLLEKGARQIDALMDRAHLHRLMGNHDLAQTDAEQALSKAPQNGRVWREKAIQAEIAKAPEEAVKAYTTSLEYDPTSSTAHYRRGRVYLSQQKSTVARDDFEAVLVIDPNHLDARVQLARLAEGRRDYHRAVVQWREVVRLRPESSAARWELAQRLRQVGQVREAIEHLNTALKLNPKYPGAFAHRGVARRLIDDFNGAEEDLKKSVELAPKYTWALTQLGKLYGIQKRYDEAIAILNKAVEVDPKYASAYEARSSAYRLKGDAAAAAADQARLKELELGSLTKLNSAAEYIQRGKKSLQGRSYTRALADFDAALKLEPASAEAHCNRGIVFDEQGKLSEAIACYSQAIELHAASAIYYRRRASAHVRLKQHNQALADLAKAIPLDEGANALLDRAQLYRQLDKFDLAKLDGEAALAKSPDSARAWVESGVNAEITNKPHDAIKAYSKALELNPRSIALYMRGKLYLKQDMLAQARSDLEAVLKLSSRHLDAHLGLAKVKQASGDQEGAITQLREAVRLLPRSIEARFELGNLLRLTDRFNEAIAQLDEAIKLDPQHVEAYAVRGVARIGNNDLAGADKDISKALELSPQDPFSLRQLGSLRLSQKRADESIQALTQALALEPNSAFAYAMRARAYRLKGDVASAVRDEAKFRSLLGASK